MAKPSFERVKELDNGMVHIRARAGMDQMTLCGITDWLGTKGAEPTTGPLTCQPCRWIAEYCQSCRKLPAPRRAAR